MLRKLLIIIFVCTFIQTLSAQEFDAGIYGGVSATQIDGDSYGGYNKPGVVFGGFVNRELSQQVDWQLGLRYIMKGSRKASNEGGLDYKATLHYLEFPITMRYYHYKKLDFEGGLTVGYMVKAFEEINKGGSFETTNSFDRFEIGAVAGLNYKINESFSVAGFVEYSLIPIRPYITKPHWLVNNGQYNSVLHFSLVYNISSFL